MIHLIVFIYLVLQVPLITTGFPSARSFTKKRELLMKSYLFKDSDNPKKFYPKTVRYEYETMNGSTIMTLPIITFCDEACLPTGEMPIFVTLMKERQVMNDLHKTGNKFGVVMANSEGELFETGTLVVNSFRKLLEDGRQIALNDGQQRFKLLEILNTEPYIMAMVEYNIKDHDVSAAESSGDELPDGLLQLEREVFSALQDVVNLNNKIADSLDYSLSEQVLQFAPTNSGSRVSSASDFSFAVCDMLDISDRERQLCLDCNCLSDRLQFCLTVLRKLRQNLMNKVNEVLNEPFN